MEEDEGEEEEEGDMKEGGEASELVSIMAKAVLTSQDAT